MENVKTLAYIDCQQARITHLKLSVALAIVFFCMQGIRDKQSGKLLNNSTQFNG